MLSQPDLQSEFQGHKTKPYLKKKKCCCQGFEHSHGRSNQERLVIHSTALQLLALRSFTVAAIGKQYGSELKEGRGRLPEV